MNELPHRATVTGRQLIDVYVKVNYESPRSS